MSALDRIVPKPVKLTESTGVFPIKPDTVIGTDEAATERGNQLSEMLSGAMGRKIRVVPPTPQENCIALSVDPNLSALSDEGYRLNVTPRRAEILAKTSKGTFWGMQTLRQLLPVEAFSSKQVDAAWEIPCVSIEDQPRFAWRGMHLDCCRHFMPIEFIYKWIDLLSLHKMNVFHWHLTEDQGWRIEIKKYPKLTEIGAWRKETLVGHASEKPQKYDGKRHGGFYSQDEVQKVVKYAADRNVTIVPEIEMPGHAQAAIAAYPELGVYPEKQLEVWTRWGVSRDILNANESTIRFFQDVLSEVLELFPSKFIHIGGDEAAKDQWKASPQIQARIKELGLKDEHELQSWFIKRMDTFLTEKGRRLVGWDEILEGGLAAGATVMSWRGEEGGVAAAKAGHDVVMAPNQYVYFDHYQSRDKSKEPLAIGSLTPLEEVYGYEPIPKALGDAEAKHVLGAQGQLWTEYIPNSKHLEYMAFPRACALSEVVWSPKEKRELAQFLPRLKTHLERLKLWDVSFRPLDS
jgi:hexosaminidase